jgi:hypothetical protein
MEQHAGRLPGALALGYARVSTYGKTLDVQVDLFAIVEQIVDAKAQFQNLNYAPLSPVKSLR